MLAAHLSLIIPCYRNAKIDLWEIIINVVFIFQKVDPEVVFTKQERIGKGSFGEVFKGIDNRTQQVNKHFWGDVLAQNRRN